MIKPADFDEFGKYMHTFKDFWFNSAKLPKIIWNMYIIFNLESIVIMKEIIIFF